MTESASAPTEKSESWPWQAALGVGVVTFLIGVALAAWPKETVTVVAVLLALQLVITGMVGLFSALTDGEGSSRWLMAIAAAFALVVGVALFANPLQTLTFVGWAAGLCVFVLGISDLIDALLAKGSRHRGWHFVRGFLGLAAGAFLLANPDRSFELLVVVIYVWLIAYGFITIVGAFLLRAEERRDRGTVAA